MMLAWEDEAFSWTPANCCSWREHWRLHRQQGRSRGGGLGSVSAGLGITVATIMLVGLELLELGQQFFKVTGFGILN